jgi:hypothetical protein
MADAPRQVSKALPADDRPESTLLQDSPALAARRSRASFGDDPRVCPGPRSRPGRPAGVDSGSSEWATDSSRFSGMVFDSGMGHPDSSPNEGQTRSGLRSALASGQAVRRLTLDKGPERTSPDSPIAHRPQGGASSPNYVSDADPLLSATRCLLPGPRPHRVSRAHTETGECFASTSPRATATKASISSGSLLSESIRRKRNPWRSACSRAATSMS